VTLEGATYKAQMTTAGLPSSFREFPLFN